MTSTDSIVDVHVSDRANAGRVGVIATVLNLIGLGIAIYLTIEHYSAVPTYACPVTGIIDCLKVTSSSYSEFAGVPVAPAGLFYFVVSLVLHLPSMWRSTNRLIAYARWVWVLLGMVSVFWLVYAELFKLDAICLYCTGVHVVTFLLLIVTAIGTVFISPPRVDDEDDEELANLD